MRSTTNTSSPDLTGRWFRLIALIWSVVITASLFWNLYAHDRAVDHFVGAEAGSMIEGIIVARSWNARHGGVYVKTSEEIKPNPSLKGLVNERDITATSGTELTLINPAYMTRQLNELLADASGRMAHITSLKPIRPENAADAWETRALQSFERGAKEFQELTDIAGKPYMRLMRPLLVEKSCLQCHAQQGYKEGDIRGGISASISMQEHLAVSAQHKLMLVLIHALLWGLGLAGLWFGRSRIAAGQLEKRASEQRLIASERRYRELYENSPLGYQSLDKNGRFVEVNPSLCWMLGYKREELVNRWFGDFLTPESTGVFKSNFPKFKAAGAIHAVPFEMLAKDGHTFSVEIDGRIGLDGEGDFKQTHCVIHDVTERKQAEKRIQAERDTALLYLNTASVMMVVINKDKSVALANKKACQVLGYAEHEVLGKNWFENFLPEKYIKDVSTVFDQIISGDSKAEAFYENPIINRDGEERLIAWHNSVIRDETGAITSLLSSGEDITERKQAEAALQKSEAHMHTLIETLPDLVWLKDQEGVYLSCNHKFERFFGADEKDIVGKTDYDFVDQALADAFRMNDKRAMAAGKPSINEEELTFASDGHSEIVETIKTPMYDPEGKLVGVLGIARDITERKQAAIALEASEKRFRSIFSQTFQFAGIVSLDGILMQVNDNALEFIGAQEADVLGKPFWDTPWWSHSKALSQWLRESISKAAQGELIRREVTHYSHSGELHYFDFSLKPVLNEQGEPEYLIPESRDITDHKNAEESLNTLSQAIQQAGESILITDRDGIIEYINPAFTTLTGYSAEESVGQPVKLFKTSGQGSAVFSEMWDTITAGDVWYGKVIDRKKDGSHFPSMLTVSPISDESANITHFVAIQSDLTRLDEMEHQFHQAQKMEALGTLVGGIAHDFNNMLAGITGNLYLVKKKVEDNPDALLKLTIIEQLAFRASAMIQQLLTFARKDQVSMKPVPLAPFIKETLKFLRSSVPENILINQDICSEPILVHGDATQLHQVLMNLVNNARDAMEEIENPTIKVRLQLFHTDARFMKSHTYFRAGSYARLSVEDNGCGIAEDQIIHLFEPFFTTKEPGKGTGLGLAMVFGAVKTHHGFVEVESSEGKGSSFHIYLPLLDADKSVTTVKAEQKALKGNGETILLVDDEPNILETGKEVLESLGYNVLVASDGESAVNTFDAHAGKIGVVIMDVVMPVMGGDKAASEIRLNHPHAKVIFATGYDRGAGEGMADEVVLDKPFSIAELSRLIREQLDC